MKKTDKDNKDTLNNTDTKQKKSSYSKKKKTQRIKIK